MISMDEARARVARGAAHLDTVRPGWWTQIDDGVLKMCDSGRCIVGQLGRGDYSPYIDLKISVDVGTVVYGFLAGDGSPDELLLEYRILQDAWIEAIADRRLRETPQPEPVAVEVGR